MAVIETWYEQDLNEPVKVHYLDGNVFSQDNNGNLVGVRVFDGETPATLSGSVSASVIRADGATVAVAGVLSNNECYVILPQAAYAVPGVLSVVVKLMSGGSTTTLCAVVANVYQSATDTTVDPGTIIPSIQDLIDAIDEAVASIPLDYSALVNAVKGTYITAASMTSGNYTKFIELPYGDYLCYFADPTAYGFPAWLGSSFYLHVSEKAYGTGYAYKTFYAYSNSKTAGWTMAGGSSSVSNLPAWQRIARYDDIFGVSIGDTELTSYGTFLDVPFGVYFVYISTPGTYGFPLAVGQSFFMEVSGSKADGSYKTFKVYGNNGSAYFAVATASSSSSNLPKWNRTDANQRVLSENDITSFVTIPQGTYEIYLSEAGTKGFPSALGQSFVLTVSKKTHNTYAYVTWTAYGNNGTAMYAVGGNSTSEQNPPVWYYLTSNNGGGSVGGVNKFSDPLETVKLLLLGDSITQGAGATNLSNPVTLDISGLTGTPKTIYQDGNSWAGLMKAYIESEYPNITVLNHGWGGISLSQMAAYIDDLVPSDTTHCIIGLGVNSEGQTSFDGPISTIINYLLDKGIKVFAWTSWVGSHADLSNINTAGRVQAALVHAYRNVGVEPLCVYSIAKRYIDENELTPSQYMQPDSLVHPNDLGHKILFRIIREGFGF